MPTADPVSVASRTALITGATAGIGASFARQLAAQGVNLVLVARDVDRLASVSEDLQSTYGISAEVLPADLADRAQTQQVADRLEDPEQPIDLLINNAGFGLRSNMLDPDTSEDERALDVMCRAVLILAGAAGRAMKARGHGQIINISSTAGFVAMGHYSAVKAWVTAYSESLATQLKGTGVTVTALCPGWVHTEFHERANINSGSIPDFAWIEPDDLVRQALADAEAGRVISIPTVKWKAAMTVAKFAPRASLRWVSGKLTSKRH